MNTDKTTSTSFDAIDALPNAKYGKPCDCFGEWRRRSRVHDMAGPHHRIECQLFHETRTFNPNARLYEPDVKKQKTKATLERIPPPKEVYRVWFAECECGEAFEGHTRADVIEQYNEHRRAPNGSHA